ncbi:Na+/H+ antiporter NhaC family protein, partial [Streptococcus pasteurianus]|nr:Na+/H+ antiporter NhaC family protein [Streptococcus pasteurianus]
ALQQLTDQIRQSKLCQTVSGTELAMMLGITLTTILFGGVSSASMTTFGKVQNELGQACQLHPYRRANLLDGFANGLGVAVPFLSVFIFVGSQLTQGYEFVAPLSVTQIAPYLFHSYNLFLAFLISILTGWGRRFEGQQGK